MNRRDLFESMAYIDSTILERSERRKRPARRPIRWWNAVAAVVAVALLLPVVHRLATYQPKKDGASNSSIADTTTSTSETQDAQQLEPVALSSFARAEAEYPEMAPYVQWDDYTTLEGFDSEGYYDAYSLWEADVEAQRQEPGYADSLTSYFSSSISAFLSAQSGENRAFSPLNVYFALGMMAEFSDEAGQQEILSLLSLPNMEALRSQAKAVWNGQYRDDGATTMRLASSLWMDEGFSLDDATLSTLAETYYASSYQGEMGSTRFNQALQAWLNRETGNRLLNQVNDLTLNQGTVLALATTVFYQAKWQQEFSPALTSDAIFYAAGGNVTCDMMQGTYYGNYYWGDHFSAVGKPMENGGGTMWLVLPDEGVAVDELLADQGTLAFLLSKGGWSQQKEMTIHLSLPRFDLTSEMDLVEGLKALGVQAVFDGGLPLTQMPHGVRVTTDEEGVTAVAYTVMEYESAEPEGEEIAFTLDRPFLFAITSEDGLPLFVGVVETP